MFRQYNKLVNAGILPVYVSVDGIEVKSFNANKATKLFDIGTNDGQWKIEEINVCDFIHIGVIERCIHEPPPIWSETQPDGMPLIDPNQFFPRLTHISGPAGNGKTEFIVNLSKTYLNTCYMAPTHDACSELERRGIKLNLTIKADTYHKVFGIGCKFPRIPNASLFIIDEGSMVPDEHLEIIDTKLREKFNPELSFGGKSVMLSGDFNQLPPIKPLTPLLDTWTGEKTELYREFHEMELTENWRQKADPTFYNLCQKLRNKLTIAEAEEIIDTLNDRCLSDEDANIILPDASSVNDMYIAGVNAQCDIVNKKKYKGKMSIGTKIICVKTIYHKKVKIPNGKIGVVLENIKGSFIVEFQDIGRMSFRGLRQEFRPAYALTVHKSQGRTMTGKVIINPTRLFEKNHLYVALTRATKFENIHLTSTISMKAFTRTVYVEGRTNLLNQDRQLRLRAMVKRYIGEEPLLRVETLVSMREEQKNNCCYCHIKMVDTFGFPESITLERISNDKTHTLDNIKLACFKCNSQGVGQTTQTRLPLRCIP
jgi:hypothetical protein